MSGGILVPKPADVRVVHSRILAGRRHREVLQLCGHAVRVDAHCIGWMPWQFYEHHDAAGTLLTCFRDGDLVGFLAWNVDAFAGHAKVMQVWVRRDARMIEHGRALVGRLDVDAGRAGCRLVSLWCAEDLAANTFWRAIGFTFRGERLGRGNVLEPEAGRPLRRHFHWTREVEHGGQVERRRIVSGPSDEPDGAPSVREG